MSIQIESTTDTKEQVTAAIGGAAQKKSEADPKSASSPDEETDEKLDASDASKTEDNEEGLDSSDGDEDDSKDDDQSKEEGEQKPKKNKGFYKRINKLNSKLSAKELEVEHWKAEALKAKAKPEPEAAKDKTVLTEADGKPKADSFDSHEEYVEALTDWKIEQKEKAKETKHQLEQFKTEKQKIEAAHTARIQEFKKTQTDFDEVVGDFIEAHGDISFSMTLEEAITTSDLGPALVYELLSHPKELMRLNSLGVVATAREIGKIEERLAKSSASAKTVEVKTSKAPPPIKTVGSKSANGSMKSPDEMDFREYKQWREQSR